MANEEHLAILWQGVEVWNTWRQQNPAVYPVLHGANLGGIKLLGADLRRADLRSTNLFGARLVWANLYRADLYRADLRGADLYEARLTGANLYQTNLSKADLRGADPAWADFAEAHLAGARLFGANLELARLVKTNLAGADLTGCRIYGLSAWDLNLGGATQKDLVVTREDQPAITVDDLEVAQFVYLLLNNEKIRTVIDTIGKKGVLLLGRFTEGRLAVLERLRDELRRRGFLPLVFNFDKPETKDFTETVRLLAGLSRFVIVDVTNPRSAPLEPGLFMRGDSARWREHVGFGRRMLVRERALPG